jgi:hypothetical protein
MKHKSDEVFTDIFVGTISSLITSMNLLCNKAKSLLTLYSCILLLPALLGESL